LSTPGKQRPKKQEYYWWKNHPPVYDVDKKMRKAEKTPLRK